jgi:hypothetical protein
MKCIYFLDLWEFYFVSGKERKNERSMFGGKVKILVSSIPYFIRVLSVEKSGTRYATATEFR